MNQVFKNIEKRVIWQKRVFKVLDYIARILFLIAFDWVFIKLIDITYR